MEEACDDLIAKPEDEADVEEPVDSDPSTNGSTADLQAGVVCEAGRVEEALEGRRVAEAKEAPRGNTPTSHHRAGARRAPVGHGPGAGAKGAGHQAQASAQHS